MNWFLYDNKLVTKSNCVLNYEIRLNYEIDLDYTCPLTTVLKLSWSIWLDDNIVDIVNDASYKNDIITLIILIWVLFLS